MVALLGPLLIIAPLLPAPALRLGPIDPTFIRSNGGYGYTALAPDLGFSRPLPGRGVSLTEDGRPLIIDHMHSAIRSAGGGRYSPWGSTLYFSATDNSDPRANGRAYLLILRRSLLQGVMRDAPWSNYLAAFLAIAGVYLVCRALASLRPRLASRPSAGAIQFSPFDLRCILRVALVYIAWREASADYAAIPRLLVGPALHTLWPSAFDSCVQWLGSALLSTPLKLAVVQAAAVALLFVAAALLRRWLLWLALAATLLIEWTAYRFRGQLPDVDPMLALLVIAALWPASWRAVNCGGRSVSASATALGFALAAYIAAVYFICGWSKVITDGPWWKVVHLELLYAALIVWMGSSPPDWLDGIARGLRDLFLRWPWLGEASALLTMVLELAWPLALLSRLSRWIVPGMMIAAHAVIFFTSGILFLPMALAGLSVLVPWRRFMPGRMPEPAPAESPLHAWMAWPAGLVAMLAVAPAMHSGDFFPFSNYQHFNWNHSTLFEPTLAYRLGYRDRATGQFQPIPRNYSGFMDCWGVTLAGREVDLYLNAESEQQQRAALARLLQYARALRPHRSSQRLGVLSCPPHVLGASHGIPVKWFDELHLLRARFESPHQSLDAHWEDCGLLLGWPEQDNSTLPQP
jgi:hypothetical protein